LPPATGYWATGSNFGAPFLTIGQDAFAGKKEHQVAGELRRGQIAFVSVGGPQRGDEQP
jgi:hypothetical protein